jgi:hypothetical protein
LRVINGVADGENERMEGKPAFFIFKFSYRYTYGR